MRRIHVNLERNSYDIQVEWGSLSRIGALAMEVLKTPRCALLTDRHIWDIHGESVVKSLQDSGFELKVIIRPAGEAQKSLNAVSEIYDELVDAHLDRNSGLIAFGGGVIGDLGGFIAATFMRGIPYIQVPTTLLAQVDSSVGGKVGVNHDRAKNLIGAFHQPVGVFVDPSILKTLPNADFIAGLAEVIKYGVIKDAPLFQFILDHHQKLLDLSSRELEHIIATSCEIKAEVVSKDEKESGLRAILNYGHTIGHALEAEEGYGNFRHGEAVSLGMIAAARISERIGLAESGLTQLHDRMLSAVGLPTKCQVKSPHNILERMYHDKKILEGRLRFVLANQIGSVVISDQVTDSLVLEILNEWSEPAEGGSV